ncbi:family 16 glycosylhydrolase [Pseudarthrobacter sp. C1]|uniref:family 16 glycosylhydrolase n=1 Tax=Pseudarthrobacter sp. C1 TaxID=3108940 RepID=UPI002B060C82|nr:family 16 glycosylhydrolase [Pseudarthrobacter sp. C1]MEA3550287.1 family 16 glycosylhydrolase [Pseudarthrobacter sp. C1]
MANRPRNGLFAWMGAPRTPRHPVPEDGTSPAESIKQPARTGGAVLMIVSLALTIGSLSVAANTPGPQPPEGKDAEPVTQATGSAQPATGAPTPEPTTSDPGPPQPIAEAGSPEPTAETASPEPTQDGGSGPAANTESSPSLEAVPVGDLPGWRQVFVEDFTDGDVPLGGFPGIYGSRWSETYKDGTPDTHAKTQEKAARTSGYFPSKVLSVHDGLLDMYLHSENGVSMGAAPSPKFDGASQPPYNSQLYGRYSVRFKADAVPGFKVAWLLWPVSKQWPQDGEVDFPEGDLSKVIYAALHGIGPDGHTFDVFRPNVPFTDWHVATTEWSPGRIEFFLDGKSIGVATSMVPNTPMRYILQTESCLTGCPAPDASGHVYVDWVAIWARN